MSESKSAHAIRRACSTLSVVVTFSSLNAGAARAASDDAVAAFYKTHQFGARRRL
jgi:hypothetical protein